MRSAPGTRHDWLGSPLAVGLAVAIACLTASVLARLLAPGPLVVLIAIGAAGVTAGYSTSGSV